MTKKLTSSIYYFFSYLRGAYKLPSFVYVYFFVVIFFNNFNICFYCIYLRAVAFFFWKHQMLTKFNFTIIYPNAMYRIVYRIKLGLMPTSSYHHRTLIAFVCGGRRGAVAPQTQTQKVFCAKTHTHTYINYISFLCDCSRIYECDAPNKI